MTKKRKVRSGPVYIETPRGTISLVFEGTVQQGVTNGSRLIGKPDYYLIDGDGVRLVRRQRRLLGGLLAGLSAFLLLWAISRR